MAILIYHPSATDRSAAGSLGRRGHLEPHRRVLLGTGIPIAVARGGREETLDRVGAGRSRHVGTRRNRGADLSEEPAYELTSREQEITQLIARGFATGAIASRLHLSPHTVRDYVKAVLDKVGVSSRGELVAKLFAEHYAEAHFDPAEVDSMQLPE